MHYLEILSNGKPKIVLESQKKSWYTTIQLQRYWNYSDSVRIISILNVIDKIEIIEKCDVRMCYGGYENRIYSQIKEIYSANSGIYLQNSTPEKFTFFAFKDIFI